MIEAARSLGFAARFASGYFAVPFDGPEAPGRFGPLALMLSADPLP
jgi:hypothetical protein